MTKELLKIELRKLLSRKSIIATFLLVVFINLTYFYFFDYKWNDVYVTSGDGKSVVAVEGKKSIEIKKKIGNFFSGEINSKNVKEMKKEIKKISNGYIGYNEDQKILLLNKFKNQIALIKKYNEKDGGMLNGIKMGYCEGEEKFVTSFSNTMALSLGLLLIVGVANIYNEEKKSKMMYIIGCTENGRTKLTIAKLGATSIYCASLYIILFVLNLLLYGMIYGFKGLDCHIQSSLIFTNSIYNITYGRLLIIMFIIGIISCIAMGIVVLIISATLKNSVAVTLMSILIYYFPVFFDMSSVCPIIEKILELMPIYMINIKDICVSNTLYFNQNIHMQIGGFLGLIICILGWGFLYKYMQKNKVWDNK